MTRAVPPLLLYGLGLALALAAMAAVFAQAGGLPELPLHDFVEYWAAGRLLLHGENPYDPALVHELERQAGRGDEGILMWNPPWALPLVLPFGLLDVRVAHVLWLLMNLAVVGFCADRLWRVYRGDESHRLVALLLACTFLPTYFALVAGQISPLLLLGATLFLVFVRRGDDYLAGAAAALLGVKPHLAYLFWLALLVWAIRERRWRVIFGGVAAGLILTKVALLMRPTVLYDYWHTLTTSPPAQYRSPTLGMLLRLATDGGFRWQFVPMVGGLAWLGRHLWNRRESAWDWADRLPVLLLVSMLTTPYGGWPFDLVLLLVPVIHAAATCPPRLRPAAITAYAAFGAIGLTMLLCGVEYLGFIWMTPAVLAGYVALLRPSPVHEPSPGPRTA